MAGNDDGVNDNGEFVYRISTADEWEALQTTGSTFGGELDKSTGCIHLSKLDQVQSTLQNFYLDTKMDLYLLQIDSKKLGDGLIYEVVDGSNIFPHFYGPSRSFSPLPLDAVSKAEKLSVSGGIFSCSLLGKVAPAGCQLWRASFKEQAAIVFASGSITLGGILLGPSALGRKKEVMNWIFPPWSKPILESTASIGLLFFLFLVGLELDLSSIRRSGKKALGIAIAGISLPFLFGVGITFLLRRAVAGADQVGYAQSLLFMGVSLSITAFPVLARILAELKLLTTQVGETAMAAAAFNDVTAWVLLALAIAETAGGDKSPLITLWVLLSGVAFVAFMLLIVKPALNWVSLQSSPAQETVDETLICLTLAGVMVSGFVTDFIGIHSIFGAFVFGLTIPKGGEFAGRLIKRIEDFVSGLLLPLYFASSGLKTNVGAIHGAGAWGLLAVVITTACAGKILGTFVVAMMCTIPARDSLALGLLMNTKGLVELIVLNIGKERKVLNDEMFAILVLMALFTTFMTTPAVMAIYRPQRVITSREHKLETSLSNEDSHNEEFRVLACVHGPENSPSLINLIEAFRSSYKKSSMKLYVMHLVQLTDRSSSIVMVRKARKNGFPCINRFYHRGESQEQVAAAFEAYGQLTQISVRSTTAISTLSTMHKDICHFAEDNGVNMIILPFHKIRRGDREEEVSNVGPGWSGVNQRVLAGAPCTTAVIMDRGFSGFQNSSRSTDTKRVCIVFLGGPDDRKALGFGGAMAEHSAVRVTVVRFVEKVAINSNSNITLRPSPDECKEESSNYYTNTINTMGEKELDEAAIVDFQERLCGLVEYVEKTESSITESVMEIGRSTEYELIIVGKAQYPSAMVTELAHRKIEFDELGPIGNLLASSGKGMLPSVVVIQQHELANAEEDSVSKLVWDKDTTVYSV